MEAGQAYRATSIDAPDRREGTIASRLGQIDAGFDRADNHQMLGAALAQLPEREQQILRLRYVDGLTQSQIAERIGVSQMHVSRLLTASIARLRESFAET
jgi:RNA polymerase sigma-B factor